MPNQHEQPLSGVPYLDEYFGVWSMYEPKFNAHVQFAKTVNVQLHLEQHATPAARDEISAAAGGSLYEVARGGLAIVELRGTMLKHASSFSSGTSTTLARRKLRAAAADDQVAGIMLVIDSPGGTVAGMHDLARDIAAAAKIKPVHAFAEDLCCSAAYWAASQAAFISAGEGAIVGSIGVFNVVHDLSKYAENEGVEVHVVRFGAFKGAAVPGTKVTEEQLAEYQKLVNAYGADFVAAVSAGRKLPKAQVEQLADGRVHKGQTSADLKLSDAIESFDDAMRRLAAATSQGPGRAKGKAMSEKSFEQQLAERRDAIAAACPGADAAFVANQVAQGATPEAAGKAYMTALAQRATEAEAKAKAAEAEAAEVKKTMVASVATPKGASRTNEPVAQGDGAGADAGGEGGARAEFTEKVDALVEAGMSRPKAVTTVNRKHPELRERVVAEANPDGPAGKPIRK